MVFTEENRARLEEILKRYPPEHRRAAMLPTLWLAQSQEGHLSPETLDYVADLLQLTPMQVLETASYYDMFRLKPCGRHEIRLCTNLSCSLLGAGRLLDWLSRRLGILPGGTTADGSVSLTPVQCLGDCEKAPMMQLDGRVEGHLSEEKLAGILSELP
jgi:NADH-quinone oxidoreductase subunit E